jgi:uncharacterized protein
MVESVSPRSLTFFRGVFHNARELRAGWRLLIFLAILIILMTVTNVVMRRWLYGPSETVFFLAREMIRFFILVLASWIMGRMEHRTIAEYGLPGRRMFRTQFWQGAVLGFAAITGLLVAMRTAGVFHFAGIALRGGEVWKWGTIWLLIFVLGALREEFRARGYALFTLSTGLGFWPAAIISAVYFGYTHYGNQGENWLGLFNAGAFGLLMCLLLRRTGNLWMPIGLHTAFNWGETYFYGVADSGQVRSGHLLNSVSAGPAWISGGTVGPEGSVLCTMMIVLLWFICAAWLREVKYPKTTPIQPKVASCHR